LWRNITLCEGKTRKKQPAVRHQTQPTVSGYTAGYISPIHHPLFTKHLATSSTFYHSKNFLYEDQVKFNPLNAELNPSCHSLKLLGNLTFMGTCIVSIFQYISNKMQRYTVHLYLETALHVSGGTSTHHQERIQLYLQHLVCHTVTAICRYRGRVRDCLSVLWVAYATHSTLKPVPTLPR
jgi:hypothetical protein